MHLIQQHTFDIQCSSPDFGKEVHSQLSTLLEKEFYPKLEELLNKYDSKKNTLSLDVLNIEITAISKKYWKEELIRKSLTQIEVYLKRNQILDSVIKEVATIVLISNSNHAESLFFEFLKTGKVIENTIAKELEKLVNEIEVSESFSKELLLNFERNSSYLMRWIFSVPPFFKEIVIKKLDRFPIENKTVKRSIDKIKRDTILKKQWLEYEQWINYFENIGVLKDSNLKEFVQLSEDYFEVKPKKLRLVCEFVLGNSNSTSTTKDLFEKIKRHVDITFSENKVELFDDCQVNNTINGTGLNNIHYIGNAGLVILHPFLKALFEQLDLCEVDGNWKNKMSQHKAILLTQYLVNSSENIEENDLILNKILCGCPIEEVVNVKLEIATEEKEKCNSLLEAVKEHWKIMSTSSTEALQLTFLQREAKFELVTQSKYELWVAESGVDILLEQLPWGISMIKTPWMENYLNCHWQY